VFRPARTTTSTPFSPVTPSDYLDRHPVNQVATPCASSWGKNGYNEQWLN
jgi:1,4-alpha-glucan branching enzyme